MLLDRPNISTKLPGCPVILTGRAVGMTALFAACAARLAQRGAA